MNFSVKLDRFDPYSKSNESTAQVIPLDRNHQSKTAYMFKIVSFPKKILIVCQNPQHSTMNSLCCSEARLALVDEAAKQGYLSYN